MQEYINKKQKKPTSFDLCFQKTLYTFHTFQLPEVQYEGQKKMNPGDQNGAMIDYGALPFVLCVSCSSLRLQVTTKPTLVWKFDRVYYIVIDEEEHRFNFPAGVFLLMNRDAEFVLLQGRKRREGSVPQRKESSDYENDTR